MYLNKVQIIGNLTKEPELKALPSGSSVINISVATNRTWKDQNGAKQEAVDFHNVIGFGKQAETIMQYVKKGHQIYIEGRLQTRSWEGQDGKKQYRTEVVMESFQFGNNKKEENTTVAPAKREQTAEEMLEYPEDEILPEDIPF